MHLVQLLLPVRDKTGKQLSSELFARVARELTERFGGVTAYSRAPARGLWEDSSGRTEPDDIVVHEVMTDSLDQQWWAEYRGALEARFAQAEVVIRALPMQQL